PMATTGSRAAAPARSQPWSNVVMGPHTPAGLRSSTMTWQPVSHQPETSWPEGSIATFAAVPWLNGVSGPHGAPVDGRSPTEAPGDGERRPSACPLLDSTSWNRNPLPEAMCCGLDHGPEAAAGAASASPAPSMVSAVKTLIWAQHPGGGAALSTHGKRSTR